MQISTGTTPAKRTRAKASDSSPSSTAAPKKSRRKATGAAVASETQIEIVTMEAAPAMEDLTGLIATTAYFIAAERNFAAGRELDDWLEAERRIKGA